jgi:hypothetical protein
MMTAPNFLTGPLLRRYSSQYISIENQINTGGCRLHEMSPNVQSTNTHLGPHVRGFLSSVNASVSFGI